MQRPLRPRATLLAALTGLALSCDHGSLPVEPVHGETLPDAIIEKAQQAPLVNKGADETLAAPSDSASIQGEVSVSPDLQARVRPGAVLFIMARSVGATSGPPLASVRMTVDKWPVGFQLGQANVMLEGTRLEGSVTLSARLDTDGNAMTRGPGDIQGTAPAPVPVGAAGVELELDQAL